MMRLLNLILTKQMIQRHHHDKNTKKYKRKNRRNSHSPTHHVHRFHHTIYHNYTVETATLSSYYPPPPDPYFLSRSMLDLTHTECFHVIASIPSTNTSPTDMHPSNAPQYPQYPPPPFAHQYHHHHIITIRHLLLSHAFSVYVGSMTLREQGAPNCRTRTFIPSKMDAKQEKKEADRTNNNVST
eukprot:395398_1